jgi:hypothetical protein
MIGPAMDLAIDGIAKEKWEMFDNHMALKRYDSL